MSISVSQEDKLSRLEQLIKGINVAMLVTITSDGTLRSRPMATQCDRFDGTLWFFTDRNSGKVFEVEEHAQVNVSYADRDQQRYVSVSGTASLSPDREIMRQLWSPYVKIWFPGGVDDPQLALLRVQVSEAEYWDAPSGSFVLLTGLVKRFFQGERPDDLGEHEKVTL